MTTTPITPGDNLAAVVAELRNPRTYMELPPFFNALADRLERLDAEMRKGITREDTDVVMPFRPVSKDDRCGYQSDR